MFLSLQSASEGFLTLAIAVTVAPLQAKAGYLQQPLSAQIQLAGFQSTSSPAAGQESLRTGEGLARGTVAGRILPLLPHDPGPGGTAGEKVIVVDC